MTAHKKEKSLFNFVLLLLFEFECIQIYVMYKNKTIHPWPTRRLWESPIKECPTLPRKFAVYEIVQDVDAVARGETAWRDREERWIRKGKKWKRKVNLPRVCWPMQKGGTKQPVIEWLWFSEFQKIAMIDATYDVDNTGWVEYDEVVLLTKADFLRLHGSFVKSFSAREQVYTLAERACSFRPLKHMAVIPHGFMRMILLRAMKTDTYARKEWSALSPTERTRKRDSFLSYVLSTNDLHVAVPAIMKELIVKKSPLDLAQVSRWLTGRPCKLVEASYAMLVPHTDGSAYGSDWDYETTFAGSMLRKKRVDPGYVSSHTGCEDETSAIYAKFLCLGADVERETKRQRREASEGTRKRKHVDIKYSEMDGSCEEAKRAAVDDDIEIVHFNTDEWNNRKRRWFMCDWFDVTQTKPRERILAETRNRNVVLSKGKVYIEEDEVVAMYIRQWGKEVCDELSSVRRWVLSRYSRYKHDMDLTALKQRMGDSPADVFADALLDRFIDVDAFLNDWIENKENDTMDDWLAHDDFPANVLESEEQVMVEDCTLADVWAVQSKVSERKDYFSGIDYVLDEIEKIDGLDWPVVFEGSPRVVDEAYFRNEGISGCVAEKIIKYTPFVINYHFQKRGNMHDRNMVDMESAFVDMMLKHTNIEDKQFHEAVQVCCKGDGTVRIQADIRTCVPRCMREAFYGKYPRLRHEARKDAWNIIRNTSWATRVPLDEFVNSADWENLRVANNDSAVQEMRCYEKNIYKDVGKWENKCTSCHNRVEVGTGKIGCPYNGDVGACAKEISYTSTPIAELNARRINPARMWANQTMLF